MPKKPKQQQKPYPSDLNRPIRIKSPPRSKGKGAKLINPDVLDDIEERAEKWSKETIAHLGNEELRKMSLLFKHYEIEENDPEKWFRLSFSLARNHVRGFDIEMEDKVGAPPKWDMNTDTILYFDVIGQMYPSEGIAATSIKEACENLSKMPSWKSKNITKQRLQNRYTESQNTELPKYYQSYIKQYANNDHGSALAKTFRSTLVEVLKVKS